MKYPNRPVTILDTAGLGSPYYGEYSDEWIREGNAFILVYSVCSRSSYSQIRQIYQQIYDIRSDSLKTGVSKRAIPIILVGSQNDKVSSREVSEIEGNILGTDLDCPFVETSAMSPKSTGVPFTILADLHTDLESKGIIRVKEVPERQKSLRFGSAFREATTRVKKKLNHKTGSASPWKKNYRFWLRGEKVPGVLEEHSISGWI
jgi:GTPase SAR1 family protein